MKDMARMRNFEVKCDKINVHTTYSLLTLYILRKNKIIIIIIIIVM